jgi:hypothetical protein
MGKKNDIRRFNMFNLQNESNLEIQKKIQQLLYYAESRFWSILNTFKNSDYNRNSWCQKLLHRELVN